MNDPIPNLRKFRRQLAGLITGELKSHVGVDSAWGKQLYLSLSVELRERLNQEGNEADLRSDDIEMLCDICEWDAPRKRWKMCCPPYADYRRCLPDVREALAPSVADEFAKASQSYIEHLNGSDLSLAAGVDLVGNWIKETDRLIEAVELRVNAALNEERSAKGMAAPRQTETAAGSTRVTLSQPTKPVSLSYAAKRWFNMDRRSLKELIDSGAVTARKISPKKWQFELGDLPAGVRDDAAP